MKRSILMALLILPALFLGSCKEEASTTAETLIRDDKSTVYGFFPSPPEITYDSVFQLYENFGEHSDVVLYQQGIPWKDFKDSPNAESQVITDLANQQILARRENQEGIYVMDPLNGMNRREFHGLPFGWKNNFANPDLRSAYRNFTLRVVREFRPRYLGLASEINTYADAFPEDFSNFLSLYRELYDEIKAEFPDILIFTTFQWEDLNNLWPQPFEPDYVPGEIKWHLVEAFEPRLDLWVISSYPYISFESAADLPTDYYTPLLTRTAKPLAVAEGGWISEDFGDLTATESDQVGYLNAVNNQLGDRLAFWIYLLLQDIEVESYGEYIKGRDLETLGFFTTVGMMTGDGEPKPALALWDSIRSD